MRKKEVKVTANDDTYILRGALISGELKNEASSPISMYCGPVDLDEIHKALYYANRTVVKILMDEFGIPLDKTDDFLVSAMSEALVKEFNNQAKGVSDLDYIRTRVHYSEDL